MKTVIVATNNENKLAEFRDILKTGEILVISMKEAGVAVDPEENGRTSEENARIKALASAKASGLPALSDDSGLAIDALDGAPGVYTANWAEREDGSRDFNMAMVKVETALAEKGATTPEQRTGRFVSVLCLAWPDGHTELFRGEVEGHIVWPPRGSVGFGYDPVFQPVGYTETFGEMPAEAKHGWKLGDKDALSHRARAFKLFVETCLEG